MRRTFAPSATDVAATPDATVAPIRAARRGRIPEHEILTKVILGDGDADRIQQPPMTRLESRSSPD